MKATREATTTWTDSNHPTANGNCSAAQDPAGSALLPDLSGRSPSMRQTPDTDNHPAAHSSGPSAVPQTGPLLDDQIQESGPPDRVAILGSPVHSGGNTDGTAAFITASNPQLHGTNISQGICRTWALGGQSPHQPCYLARNACSTRTVG